MTEEEYDKTVATLLKHIRLVPAEETGKNWGKAMKIMAHIDEEDVVFIATALSVPDSVIWSNDKDFERQDKVKVLKTKEMVKF